MVDAEVVHQRRGVGIWGAGTKHVHVMLWPLFLTKPNNVQDLSETWSSYKSQPSPSFQSMLSHEKGRLGLDGSHAAQFCDMKVRRPTRLQCTPADDFIN